MKNPILQTKIIEQPYFSNWADQVFPRVANKILPVIISFDFITPNVVTIVSFLIYFLGCFCLFINFPNHLIFASVLLPISYIGDCLDGQLARSKKVFSDLGNFLDKVLDVLKIFIICGSLSLAVYWQKQNVLYIYLGFIACFFFCWRYYIKLETILSAIGRDPRYLQKSREKKEELNSRLSINYAKLKSTFLGRLKLFWFWNRTIFFVDEAEFVVFTSVCALVNRLDIALLILAISQLAIGTFRFFERAKQTNSRSARLLLPMRK